MNLIPARILGIETSCDETAASIVEDGRRILSDVVYSQADIHAQYGGVFPEVASRQHIQAIYKVVKEALQKAHLSLSEIDAVAVTRGPGLPGSLVVGMNTAKGIVMGSGKPLIGINHIEAHLYSAWLYRLGEDSPQEPEFPLLALVVSGGHSELILMEDHLTYRRLGGTLDDAAGEAFDKVARLLGLTYPGGPAIERASKNGNPEAFQFPRSRLDNTWDFSFSGLKTAVLREVKKLETQRRTLPIADLAASFQKAVVDVLVRKTVEAALEFSAKAILVAGGVSANETLRKEIQEKSPVPVHIPPIDLCTDNAAMVAGAGYYRHANNSFETLDVDVLPTWPISEI